MTDYAEEQRNEIEALQSIYPDELQVLEIEPYHTFELLVSSQSTADDVVNASCVLRVTYTPTYPDVVPNIEVKDFENLEDDYSSQLEEYVLELAEENVGMVMVFTLASAVQEKLTQLVEQIAQDKIDAENRRIKELEEAEQKRFEGTRVTVESFLAWQAAFDAEMAELKRKKGKEETVNKKLTGKELFMLDSTLDDSDVKFLEEGGEVVEVDESLFDDLDDLAIDNDVDDDDDDDENQVKTKVKS